MPDEFVIPTLPNSPTPFGKAALPREAGRRVQILRDAVRDASAFTSGLAYRTIELNDARQGYSSGLRLLQNQRAGNDHPEVVRLTAAIAAIDEERARLDKRLNAHNAATAPRADLLQSTEDWLRDSATRYGFAQVTVQTKLQKGETSTAAVDRLRRRIRELDAQRHRIESAVYSLATAEKVAREFVAARARPPIASSCLEHAGPMRDVDGKVLEEAVVLPTIAVNLPVATAQGGGVATGTVDDAIGFLCWLMPDAVVARIVDDQLRPEADDANALDHEQRRTKLATIAQDRLLLEAEECELMFAALAAGEVIEPRADTSPQAFLGVTLTTKAAVPAAADAFAGRRAHRAADETGQAWGPRDISIPGMTDRPVA